MKKLVLSLFLLSLFAFQANAQETSAPAAESDLAEDSLIAGTVNCFDYYKFGSVQVDVDSEIENAIPGVPLTIAGKIKNENSYPIVDGRVFVKIFRKQSDAEKAHSNGNLLVDQFVAQENISLAANSEKEIAFDWQVPNTALAGEYQLTTFFISAKKFNLLGLSFTDDVVGNVYNFSVDSQIKETVEFDKNSVKIDEKDYRFAAFPPRVDNNKDVSIKATLSNTTKNDQLVPVIYSLYSWDGQQQENLIEIKEEQIELNAGEAKELEYVAKDNRFPVYFVVIESKYLDSKSILDIRFVKNDVDKVRINFPAVTAYPLIKGQPVTLFSCLHNSGQKGVVDNNKLILTLLDKDQKEIHKYEYSGQVSGAMMGVQDEFAPSRDYQNFTLKAELYTNNQLVDSAKMKYDCNEIDKSKCPNSDTAQVVKENKGNINTWMVVGIVATILLIAIISIVMFIKKRNSNIPGAFIFVLAMSFGLMLAGSQADAKSVQWSETVSGNFIYDNPQAGDWDRGLQNPNFSVTYNTRVKNVDTGSVINDGASVPVGTKLSFEPILTNNEDISWFGTGFSSDSPYGRWISGASAPAKACDASDYVGIAVNDPRYKAYIPFSVNPAAVTVSHSGTAGLACNAAKTVCTVNSAGTINSRFTFSATTGMLYYRWGRDAYTVEAEYDGVVETTTMPSECQGNNTPMRKSNTNVPYVQNIPAQTINYNFTAVQNNRPPAAPTISGPNNGFFLTQYDFTALSSDPDGNTIRYGFDWNKDGTVDQYVPSSGFVNSGVGRTVKNPMMQWSTAGVKVFQVLAQDDKGTVSPWTSKAIAITATTIDVNFSAAPLSVTVGNPVTLTWNSVGNMPAACTASGAWTGAKAKDGSQVITPPAVGSYTYSLRCFDMLGQLSPIKSVTIVVSAAPVVPPSCGNGTCSGSETCSTCAADCGACPVPAATATLSANPATITLSNATTLTWTTTNASSCYGSSSRTASDGNWTGWKANNGGNQTLTPSMAGTYDYYVECWNTAGVSTGRKTVTVTVNPPAATCGNSICAAPETCITCAADCGVCPVPTLMLNANPTSITLGNPTTLSWNTTNAVSCQATSDQAASNDGGWNGTGRAINGASVLTPTVVGTYNYSLECLNSSGVSTGIKTVPVTVAAVASFCGDGSCSGADNCSNCALDCGACPPPPPPPPCGNGVCSGSETCSTCSTDCGVCSVDENWREVAP